MANLKWFPHETAHVPDCDLQHHFINHLICSSWDTGRQVKHPNQMNRFFCNLWRTSEILTCSEHYVVLCLCLIYNWRQCFYLLLLTGWQTHLCQWPLNLNPLSHAMNLPHCLLRQLDKLSVLPYQVQGL